MESFGAYLESIRKERGLSRLDFCGDESELSIRQLVRIEKGQSQPTIQSMTYIAKRLGVPSYTLLPDYQELPKRYQELKYLLLRVPVYENGDILEEKEQHFDEIYEKYYDDLPEEERVAIETIQSIIEVIRSNEVGYADSILDGYLEPVFEKEVWSINELLIIQLYFIKSEINFKHKEISQCNQYSKVFSLLPKQQPFLSLSELFILRDTIIAGLSYFRYLTDCPNLEEVLSCLKDIMQVTQDFQKKPLILMFDWKYQLSSRKDYPSAERLYQSAKLFAEVVEDPLLASCLEAEWQKDLKEYL